MNQLNTTPWNVYIILYMIETGPHIFTSKQFSKNEPCDQMVKEIELTSVKSIQLKAYVLSSMNSH